MPQIRAFTPQLTAVRWAFVARELLPDWAPSACAVVAEHLRHQGVAPAGYPFARCHPRPDGVLAAEAGFPVSQAIADCGVVKTSSLPGGPVLTICHTDPNEKLAMTYQALDDWLETAHATTTGDPWEIYHDLPTCEHLGTRIEIVQPITFRLNGPETGPGDWTQAIAYRQHPSAVPKRSSVRRRTSV